MIKTQFTKLQLITAFIVLLFNWQAKATNWVDAPPSPTVDLSTASLDVSGNFEVSVFFSVPVTGLEINDFNINNANIIDLSTGTQEFTITVQPITGGNIKISLPGNRAFDEDGEGNFPSNELIVNFLDSDPPIPFLETPLNVVEGQFEVTVTFNEPVYGLEIDDFNVSNGAIASLVGGPTVYTLVIIPGAFGEVAIFMPPDRVVDIIGNNNLVSNFLQVTYGVVDVVAPLVMLSTDNLEVNGNFVANIDFNEPVTGLILEDLVADNATITDLFGDGLNYTVLVTPMMEGQVMLFLPEDKAADEAGNGNMPSNELMVNFVLLDTQSPTVVISTPTTNVEGSFEITLTFSEEIEGLELSDLVVDNATISDLQGGPLSYTIQVTPLNDGVITISLPANQLNDLSGNGNSSSNNLTVNFEAPDIIQPDVVLSTASMVVTGTFYVDINFSESVTGLTFNDFEIINGTPLGITGEQDAYQLQVVPNALGEIQIQLSNDKVVDLSGNQNTASNQLILNYIDNIAPIATLSTNNSSVEEIFEVIVQFSEEVSGLEMSDFLIENGTLLSLEGSGQSYTLTVEPGLEGDVTIILPADQAFDLSGNGNAAASNLSVFYVGEFVEFLSLKVQREQDHLVASWTTNTEYKNKRFIVEHSTDSINFSIVDEQESLFSSNTNTLYQFFDTSPDFGINFYRVKVIFEDDSFDYTETVKFDFKFAIDEFIIFPSPAHEYVYLNLSQYEGLRCEIIIFNAWGQWFYNELFEALPDFPIKVDISRFQNGMHAVHLRIKETDKFSKKFMVLKDY